MAERKKKTSRYFEELPKETDQPAEVFTPDLIGFKWSAGRQAKASATPQPRNNRRKLAKLKRETEATKCENTKNSRLSRTKDEHSGKWKNTKKNKPLREDPFPGDAPVSAAQVKKYKRGHHMDVEGVKTKFHKDTLKAKEKKYSQATKQAARAEFLLTEQAGFLQADEGEHTCDYSQHEIAKAVDISSAQKFFELDLKEFGPYRVDYTRNGRNLLLGGSLGHVAAIDWQTKQLMCEMNVMETCHDVVWLHQETMFAVAQKQWTYIYDNQGIELHCLKALDSVLRMEFLPYHFLLATSNAKSYLSWLDISVGKKVAGFPTGLGRLDVMCQNPSNAIIHLGHSGGTVTMWSPNVKEPLVKMLCHSSTTRSLAVDITGRYMATSGVDRTLKLWDLRTYKQLQSYKLSAGAGHMAFSQTGNLALGKGNVVEVYQDCVRQPVCAPYVSHRLQTSVRDVQFCAYEDVLGVGHGRGFSSLLIPGAGEPNIDALEANPYQTKKQRQHSEVKMLLEKIQPELINVDTLMLGRIDTKSLQEQMEEKQKLLYLKPQAVDFEPKYKKKGRSKTGRLEKRKKGVQEEAKREQVRTMSRQKQQQQRQQQFDSQRSEGRAYSALGRFKKGS